MCLASVGPVGSSYYGQGQRLKVVRGGQEACRKLSDKDILIVVDPFVKRVDFRLDDPSPADGDKVRCPTRRVHISYRLQSRLLSTYHL
jgi:hypothetical protein